MKLSEITPIQVLGGVLVVNTVLAGGTAQLTDLFGPTMANHILSVCVLGSGICGGFIMNMGGMNSQVRNVLAMPGVEKIDVNGQASAGLATIAVDPAQNKIAPTPAAMATVTATAKAAAVLLIAFILSAFLAVPSAQAQGLKLKPLPDPIAKLKQDFTAATGVKATGDVPFDLLKALDKALLPDLQYAQKLAVATGSKVTAPCYGAWIDMINTQQTAIQTKNADGTTTDMPTPTPHLVTDFERMVEIRNALQPDSPFMTACSPVANMVKLDVTAFMGVVISGGAGLATLVPGL